ncbi:MAG: hypothetical protein R3B47_21700 [Bacteroidia bacterium]
MKARFRIPSPAWLLRGTLALLVLALAGAGIYALRYPSMVRCMTVSWRDFDAAADRVFVSPDTPPAVRSLLKHLIVRSEQRVSDLWGDTRSRPVIIYCHNQTYFEQFGAGSPGVAYLTPLGPYVVIGPRGMRTDVISHELCHAELFSRIGWYNSEFHKPAWFDEGLAMQLDYRYARRGRSRYFGFMVDWERRVGKGGKVFDLDSLKDRRAFTSGDFRQTELAYVTAGMEVSRWLEAVGDEGLLRFCERLVEGGNFEKIYTEIEMAGKAQDHWLSN